MSEAETPGQRLYQIRLACGDGKRTPESLKLFAERIKRLTGETYYANALSLLERDEQNWRLSDINTLAQVDPKQRGAQWLAFGGQPQTILLDPTLDRGLTEEEERRALDRAAEIEAARKKPGKGKRQPGSA